MPVISVSVTRRHATLIRVIRNFGTNHMLLAPWAPSNWISRYRFNGKGKLDVDAMGPGRLAAYAGICGKTLAFAHARSGDAMMIRGYIGDDEAFDDVMVEFADRYADCTERDHTVLSEAINDGAIEVIRDI